MFSLSTIRITRRINDLLIDIAKLITTGQRPPDRRFDKLKPINAGKKEYWRYVPGAPPTETGTP
jgi:hypothetical protein